MVAAIVIGIFIVVIFITLYFSTQNKPKNTEIVPQIYQSGVYSIIRKSPRETIKNHKPTSDQVAQFLNEQGTPAPEKLIKNWEKMLEMSIPIYALHPPVPMPENVNWIDYPRICKDLAIPSEYWTNQEEAPYLDSGVVPYFTNSIVSSPDAVRDQRLDRPFSLSSELSIIFWVHHRSG